MSHVEKISVSLSHDLLNIVREAVDSGEYGSASEVIGEALGEWELRHSLHKLEVERLRKAWDEGIASGEPEPLSMADIKAKARARFNERHRGS